MPVEEGALCPDLAPRPCSGPVRGRRARRARDEEEEMLVEMGLILTLLPL